MIRPSISFLLPDPSTIVVFSFVLDTLLAVPKSSKVAPSRVKPTSSEMTVPPVKIAISCNIALRRSPKPGALAAATLTIPLMLFTTKVANASPSMSSAITTKGFPALATFSRIGSRSLIFEIFLSQSKM